MTGARDPEATPSPSFAPLLVACSGGLDSTVLLHRLRFGGGAGDKLAGLPAEPADGRTPESWLHVAHIDHRMRPDSARDAAWVRGVCRSWSVPCTDVVLLHPPASEAAARAERWLVLEQIADAVGAYFIVTAHHRDDQIETVLHHLLRGTGLRGLGGMHVREGRRLRPLIDWPRSRLRDYARRHGLSWRDDATNLDRTFTRNRLRHDVLPLLEEVVPGAGDALVRAASHARADESALRDASARLLAPMVIEADASQPTQAGPGQLCLAREPLVALSSELRRRLLRAAARQIGGRLDARGTALADHFATEGVSGHQVHLTGGLVLERDFDVLTLHRPAAGRGPGPVRSDSGADSSPDFGADSSSDEGHDGAHLARTETPKPLAIPGPPATTQGEDAEVGENAGVGERAGLSDDAEVAQGWFGSGLNRWRVRWSRAPIPTAERAGHVAAFQIEHLAFPLAVRTRRPGDRIHLAHGSTRLKKVIASARLDRRRRWSHPVVVDAAGRVLWVPGVDGALDPDVRGQSFYVQIEHEPT